MNIMYISSLRSDSINLIELHVILKIHYSVHVLTVSGKVYHHHHDISITHIAVTHRT